VTAQNLGANGPLVPKAGEPLSPPAAMQTNKGALATPSKTKDEDLEAPSADSEASEGDPPVPSNPAAPPPSKAGSAATAPPATPPPPSAAASPKE
jgi:hypothetical protein